jgi:hypothetical protein
VNNLMKKILLSLLVVASVFASVVAGTQAVFSASASLPGNSVASATLNLRINHSAGKTWAVTNMKPGDVQAWEYMDVTNMGSIPATFYFYLDNATGSPDWNLWSNLKVELRNGTSTGAVIYDGPVSGVYSSALKINTTDFAYGTGSQMPAGSSQRIYQRVYLPSSVGDEAQGRSTTFDEVMYATQ